MKYIIWVLFTPIIYIIELFQKWFDDDYDEDDSYFK